MKVERKKSFTPITLTIESEEEYIAVVKALEQTSSFFYSKYVLPEYNIDSSEVTKEAFKIYDALMKAGSK